MFISPTRLVIGPRMRIYTSPQAEKIGDAYVPYSELIHPTRTGDNYRIIITHPDSKITDRWIVMKPKGMADGNLLKEAVFARHMDWAHFGPSLYVEDLGANTLRWDISWSDGIVYDEKTDRLVDERLPGIALSFDRWKTIFGKALTLDLEHGAATMALESVKDRLSEAKTTEAGPAASDYVLDLDPELVALGGARYYKTQAADWTITRASGTGTPTTGIRVEATGTDGCATPIIIRSVVEFDTSGLDAPGRAYLRLYGGAVTGIRLIGETTQSYAILASTANYGYVLDNILNVIGGEWSYLGGDWVMSPDIIDAGEWAAESTFRLGLMEKAHDYDNAVPAEGEGFLYIWDHTGGNAAFLELIYTSGSWLSPSPTAMRGGPF